jgi:phage-related protein
MNSALFHPKARDAIRTFPEEVRKELGEAILDLQKGFPLSMPISRPMPSVTPGANELRVRDRAGIYRTFYYTKSARGVLIFHAFVKKTEKTPLREIELGRMRLGEMLNE